MNTKGNILQVIEAKNTNPAFARVLRNALVNQARQMAKPQLVSEVPAMLKKQAF